MAKNSPCIAFIIYIQKEDSSVDWLVFEIHYSNIYPALIYVRDNGMQENNGIVFSA
jgi:hypothetical protein